VLIEPREPADPELARLLDAQWHELREREALAGAARPPQYPARAGARFLMGIVDGRAVACGALQPLGADRAELKRMYVVPGHRGRGYAKLILAALEEMAVATGHTTLRVETGDYLPEATSLYAAAGYRPVPAYGEYVANPHSVCFERRVLRASADRHTAPIVP
jgi:GNAT superfamily N-acetyltransferase